MKKVFKSFMLAAVAAVAFSACNKELNDAETIEQGEYYYSFHISNVDNAAASDTRAVLDGDGSNLFLKWENGDSFGAYASKGSTNSNNRPSTVVVSNNTYTLKVASTQELASGTSVYTYFPYNPSAGNKTAAVIRIDPIQTQNPGSFDASVMPMAGEIYTTTTTLAKDEETAVGEIRFANLGALIEFNIYATASIDEQIKSVQFNSTSGNLAGNFSLDLTAIDFSNDGTLALSGDGTENYVKTYLYTPVAIPVSNTTDKEGTKIYMSVAPGSYTGSVVVTTTDHTYTFEFNSAKTFNRSKVKRLNANLSAVTPDDAPAEEIWTPITSTSDFTAGTYVIVSSDKSKYLVNEEITKNPSCSKAHWDGSGNLVCVTSDAKWVASSVTGGLEFVSYADDDKYLWMSTSTAQGVAIGSECSLSGAAKVWSITENASLGGDSGYIATTGNSRYLSLYTNGTWRGYTINGTSGLLNNDSDILAAVFYKLEEAPDTRDDAPIAWGVTGNAAVSKFNNTYTWTNPNGAKPEVTVTDNKLSAEEAADLKAELTYSSSVPTVAEINESNGTITFIGAGTTVIKAIYAGEVGDTYKHTEIEYTLVVTDNTTYTITVNQPTGDYSGFEIAADPNTAQKVGVEITLSCTGSVDGYHFSAWDVYYMENAVKVPVTVTNNKFSMPAHNVTVEASFAADNNTPSETYTLTATYAAGSAYQYSVNTVEEDDDSSWDLFGYGKNNSLWQLGGNKGSGTGAARCAYILTPECSSDITTITVNCKGSNYVAIYTTDASTLLTDMCQKPSSSSDLGDLEFSLPSGYTQVKIMFTSNSNGSLSPGTNAACYINSVTVTTE